MAISGASAVYCYYQHSYMDSMCIFNVFSAQAFFLGCLAFTQTQNLTPTGSQPVQVVLLASRHGQVAKPLENEKFVAFQSQGCH